MFNFDLYIIFSPIITNGIICRGNAFKKGPEPPLIFQDLQYVLRSNSLSGPGPSHHRRAVATEYHRPSQGINIHIPPNGKLGKSSTQICHFFGGYVRKPWRYTPFCTLNKTGFFLFQNPIILGIAQIRKDRASRYVKDLKHVMDRRSPAGKIPVKKQWRKKISLCRI